MRATPQQTTNWTAAIEGCLIVGLGAMLLRKTWDGQLPLYIHPRYTLLVGATGIVLLMMGAVRLWQTGEGAVLLRGRIGMYALLLTPLVLGVLLPAKPAGSALVDPLTLNSGNGGYRTRTNFVDQDSTQWNLLDWTYARYDAAAAKLKGKPVDVVGFVYHDPAKSASELQVVRYVLACCVADRSGVSLPVQVPDAASLQTDSWVRVTGTIDTRPGGNVPELVVTDAKIEPVQQPQEPYLYP